MVKDLRRWEELDPGDASGRCRGPGGSGGCSGEALSHCGQCLSGGTPLRYPGPWDFLRACSVGFMSKLGLQGIGHTAGYRSIGPRDHVMLRHHAQ